MQYRAIITVDFAARDLGELAHHETRVNRAAESLRDQYDTIMVHVVECPQSGDCPDHTPVGEGARPVSRRKTP